MTVESPGPLIADAGTSEASFRLLFMSNPHPMWVCDLETLSFLEVNDAAVAHYGYSRDEFLRMRISDIRPQEDVPLLLESLKKDDALRHFGQWRHRRKDGAIIDVEVTSHSLRFAGRRADLVVAHDITARKRAQEALLEAEAKYKLLIEKVPAVTYVAEPGEYGRWLYVSPQIEQLLGFSAAEWIARRQLWASRLHPEDRSRVLEADRSVCKPGDLFRLEYRLLSKSGRTVWVSDEAVLFDDPATHSVLMRGILLDITERKHAEDAFQQAEEKYRTMFEEAIVGMFQTTPAGQFLSVNAAMARMYGYDNPQEMISSITDIANQVYVDPRRRDEFKLQMEQQGRAEHFECQVYRKDRSKMWASANVLAIRKDGVIVRYDGMVEEITQRKHLEEQLSQAQKMEAVGRLAGGVAHDFNNAIGVIVGYTALLKERLHSDDTSQRYVEEINRAGQRAASLTRQLLAFSRKQVIQPTIIDLNAVVTETEKMLRRLIGEDIEVGIILPPQLGRVRADLGQIQQILMNLAINARDAMPGGGKLILETANAELDESDVARQVCARPGRYVVLSISDTGCGMDKDTQSHIFEPFFTTKAPGKGTGLGLSTVYAIVEQSRGYIWVYSEPEKGARFKIYLPRVEDSAQPVKSLRDGSALLRGSETILVVEDEEPMRALTRTCLERHGYTVLDVENAEAAIRIVGQYPGHIHLLLTDVVMPGASGRELAESLAVARPEMKLLYMSGYTADLVAERGILEAQVALLEKPFTREALLTKVRKVLDGERSKAAYAG